MTKKHGKKLPSSGFRRITSEMAVPARDVLGANKVSAVKITRADGSVETQPAYRHDEAKRIVNRKT